MSRGAGEKDGPEGDGHLGISRLAAGAGLTVDPGFKVRITKLLGEGVDLSNIDAVHGKVLDEFLARKGEGEKLAEVRSERGLLGSFLALVTGKSAREKDRLQELLHEKQSDIAKLTLIDGLRLQVLLLVAQDQADRIRSIEERFGPAGETPIGGRVQRSGNEAFASVARAMRVQEEVEKKVVELVGASKTELQRRIDELGLEVKQQVEALEVDRQDFRTFRDQTGEALRQHERDLNDKMESLGTRIQEARTQTEAWQLRTTTKIEEVARVAEQGLGALKENISTMEVRIAAAEQAEVAGRLDAFESAARLRAVLLLLAADHEKRLTRAERSFWEKLLGKERVPKEWQGPVLRRDGGDAPI
jgi:hypothetical protein